MSKVTIYVSTEATREQFDEVVQHVQHEELHNINMQAFSLTVQWGEFTSIEADDEGDGDLLNLFRQVQNLLA